MRKVLKRRPIIDVLSTTAIASNQIEFREELVAP